MELQIIRAQEFIRLGAHGHFDLKASKAVLAQLAAACRKRGINQALVDLRALHPGPKPVFSPKDLIALVNTFREIGFTQQQRLAVLYSSDPHLRARLFAFIATVRGWKVQAFDDFEEAVTWLSGAEEPTAETEFTTRAKKVPVRKLKPLKASPKPAPQPTIVVKSPVQSRRDAASVKTRRKKSPSAFAASLAAVIALMTATALAQPAAKVTSSPANADASTNLTASAFAPHGSEPDSRARTRAGGHGVDSRRRIFHGQRRKMQWRLLLLALPRSPTPCPSTAFM